MKHEKSDRAEQGKHENELGAPFWNNRWKNGQTGWDVGHASPALTNYIAQYDNKHSAVLIPGCGNAYEAEYLTTNGFTNITLLDIAPQAVSRLKEKFKKYPQVKILCEDFYKHEGKYDLIIEQTFFCAQLPQRRREYAQKISSLLKTKGKLVGVLFSVNFDKSGPPFGGNQLEYKTIFEPYFHIKTMEACYNSIPPRAGSELFINLSKK
ncbi:MAG: Thiopurine S-methyltransferase [Cytophagales bacterium]|jgi:SAM-dependent methyltransferase|nr:methyltransferase domain-containing protein [Bacteroidota bacterium]MBS1980492.1 methyltransferase domain-containing protein [Bacteroidota bacterium]WHZ07808.1 MAG: Thiopurine S-methyltransferase [Cytophagales bacterium]